MRSKSFRFQITLLSVGISGLVLIAFILFTASLIYRAELDAFDSEITALVQRTAPQYFGPERARGRRRPGFSDEDGQRFLVVFSRRGETVFQSDYLPSSLDLSLYAFEDMETEPLMEAHGGGEDSFMQPPPRRPPEFRGDGPMRPDFRGNERERRRPGPPTPPEPKETFTLKSEEGDWRVSVFDHREFRFVAGENLQILYDEMQDNMKAVVIAFPFALVLVGLGGWFVAHRSIRPIERLTDATRSLGAKDLNHRVASAGESREIGELINVFNDMLERLERSFQQAVRFSADAAHELNTPLTILQGQLESGMQSLEPGSEMQRQFRELLDETHRLKNIVKKLLLLSLADAGKLKVHRERVHMSELLENSIEDVGILNSEIVVTQSIEPNVYVSAEPDLLNQVVQNLFTNAVKYNRPGGKIDCELFKQKGSLVFRIGNDGEPIGKEDAERVFERFYRLDKSRNREVEGTGLGLSLSLEIVRAHGGELRLDTSVADQVVFELKLPLEN